VLININNFIYLQLSLDIVNFLSCDGILNRPLDQDLLFLTQHYAIIGTICPGSITTIAYVPTTLHYLYFLCHGRQEGLARGGFEKLCAFFPLRLSDFSKI